MNVDVQRYIGINLPAYNNNTVVIIETPIVALSVKDKINWIEIATNVWYVIQFARIIEAVKKGVLFDRNLTAKGRILYGYWPPALGLLTA